eukprot:CAMPEP_0172483654 /NCGR_PEP_ID=MMETSP1066-20121228/10705_1 /TAXON_ID=671091 /ORGANISM="Coscinodiscus wailesii, Strain CCMP2513" /LENGTH=1257 /DNA_ID=CAMNT_0013247641 /DNA_START=395 /DNA_END=4168 /DNA_ORIENTATION=-
MSSTQREVGAVTSLRDSYGFIQPSTRPDELFFHFSELLVPSSSLVVGSEVSFEVGTSKSRPAAVKVERAPEGSVVWYEAEQGGRRLVGRVERGFRKDSNNVGYGLIKDSDAGDVDDAGAKSGDASFVKFTLEDYVSGIRRLARGDEVEYSVVVELRTGNRMARDIVLLQSEKERRLLSEATLEQGMIVTLKDEYGFIKSTSSRHNGEIYFHISNVIYPSSSSEKLQVNSNVKFLVVTDDTIEEQSRRRSARNVELLPPGTVEFEKVIGEGVTGLVTKVPVPAPSAPKNSRKAESVLGSVSLTSPIVLENNEEVDEVSLYVEDCPGGTFALTRDGSQTGVWVRVGDLLLFDVIKDVTRDEYRLVPTAYYLPKKVKVEENEEKECAEEEDEILAIDNTAAKTVKLLSPSLTGRCEGVVSALKDNFGFINCAERNVDAYFRLYEILPDGIQQSHRTYAKLINGSPFQNVTPEVTVGTEVSFDLSFMLAPRQNNRKKDAEKENLIAHRLCVLPKGTLTIQKTLAIGVKATVSQEHNDGSGFVQLDEPVRGMSLSERHPLIESFLNTFLQSTDEEIVFPKLMAPADCQVYINMAIMKNLETSFVKEVDGKNLIIDTLPEMAVQNGGRLRISKPGLSCVLELYPLTPVRPSSQDGDNNAIMIPSPGMTDEIPLNDIQIGPPSKIDEMNSIMDGLSLGGDTSVASSRRSGMSSFDGTSMSSRRSRKSKRKKVKPVRVIRYEKIDVVVDGGPHLALGDVVTCDVVQFRRTGAYSAINVKCVERKLVTRGVSLDGENAKESADKVAPVISGSGTGRVMELVPGRNFGFISFQETPSSTRELLFFHTSSVTGSVLEDEQAKMISKLGGRSRKRGKLKAAVSSDTFKEVHKGDEVRFDVGENDKGKRVALNIYVTAKSKEHQKATPCEGFILIEPSRLAQSGSGGNTAKIDSGRWGGLSPASKSSQSSKEGFILLTSDPANVFNTNKMKRSGSQSSFSSEMKRSGSLSSFSKGMTRSGSQSSFGKGMTRSGSQSSFGKGMIRSGSNASFSSLLESTSKVLQVTYVHESIANASSNSAPCRGDLVSFTRSQNSKHIKDVKVIKKQSASVVKGTIQRLNVRANTAVFVPQGNTVDGDVFEIDDLQDSVVGCAVNSLKEGEDVEALPWDGKVYGVCRTSDLQMDTKVERKKERPRLNLKVRNDLKGMGGKIVAQSGLAKGPDNTNGFRSGWTKRVSKYTANNDNSASPALNANAKSFVMGGEINCVTVNQG